MKKNLLVLLFMMLMGTVTSLAQDVTFTIDIDNAANATVTMNSPYGDPISLHDGVNSVSGPANRPLFVTPANGAELSVNVDGMDLMLGGGGFYNTVMVEGMVVKITSAGGGGANTIDILFSINNPGTALLTTGGETMELANGSVKVNSGEYAILAPAEGYAFDQVTFSFIEDYTENGDGTYSFMPAQYGYVSIQTKVKGTDFKVDINVPSNVILTGYSASNEELSTIPLNGYTSPYSVTAPLNVASIVFSAPAGGELKSIKRVMADGTESNVNYSPYAGWRSAFAEGDTFVIDAVGPLANVKFYGYNDSWQELDLTNFVVKAGDTTLDLSGTTAEAEVRIGEILTVTTGKGYTLKEYNAISGGAITAIITDGSVQTAMVKVAGDIFLSAKQLTAMIINVDNAAAVTVKGGNGHGDAIELANGTNTLESVANPLRITANENYDIASVALDGEAVKETNGGYTVELLAGSTIDITTRVADAPFPVTIMTTGDGSIDNLIIIQNGEVVDYAEGITGLNGTELSFRAALGYMIENISDFSGNKVSADDNKAVWTVQFTEGSSMINVEFKTPAEGDTFVGMTCNIPGFRLGVYDSEGNRKNDPSNENLAYNIESGNTGEVAIGDQVRVITWSSSYEITEIKVNGTAIEIEDGISMSDYIKIEERTVIEVTAAEKKMLVNVHGDESIDVATGSGALIGGVYINEVGNLGADLEVGDKFYVIPHAEKGYKFDGFKTVPSVLMPVPEPVDGKYEFTVPEGVEYLFFQGSFVIDEENQAFRIEGNQIYDGQGDASVDTRLVGLTRIDNGTEMGALSVMAYAGETVRLLFFLNIDEFPAEEYYCESFCLFNNPSVLIAQNYVVNPDDAMANNVISIGAIVKKRDTIGVDSVKAEGAIAYDATTATVTSAEDVNVYSISGTLMTMIPAGEGSIANLPAGVYILKSASATVKINK